MATTARPAVAQPIIDPYRWGIPSVRDASYVDRLLAYFEHRNADLLRLTAAAGGITPEVEIGLASIYAGEFLELSSRTLSREASHPEMKDDLFRIPDGPLRYATTAHLFTFSTDCIFAAVNRQFFLVDGSRTSWISMTRRTPDLMNPTGWVMIYDGFEDDGTPPANPCI
ncbi:MAG: hypothetical protein ACT4OS_09230 [Acidimicrobiales bacterium]